MAGTSGEHNTTHTNIENINRTNLEILISQNDIVPLLQKVNRESKLQGRQLTLSDIVRNTNVSIVVYINNTIIIEQNKIKYKFNTTESETTL